jgi:hypothetical protein
VAERHLAGETDEDVEAERPDGEDEDLGQDETPLRRPEIAKERQLAEHGQHGADAEAGNGHLLRGRREQRNIGGVRRAQ